MNETLRMHASTPSSTLPTLADFVVEGKLGSGGNATVHRAVWKTGEIVALKIIHGEVTHDPKYLARFQREVRAASQLDHPNVCRLFAYGEDQGRLFLAMELIEGGSVSDLVDRAGKFPPQVAALVVADLLKALGAAHQLQIVHRDVKPANAMMTVDGVLKLVDFGIAKGESDARVTETGFLVGTPAYMSPEMAVGRPTDARADLYAAGVTLFELLAGKNPYADDAPAAALLRIASESMPSIFEFDATVPGVVELVLERLVERDPDARYATAEDALRDLQPYLDFVNEMHPRLLAEFMRDPHGVSAQLAAEQAELETARAERLLLAGEVNLPAAALALYRATQLSRSPEIADRFAHVCARGGFRFGDVDDDALVAAREAVRTSPNPTGPLKRVSDLYRARGDIHRAVVFLRRYLRERPNDTHAQHQLELWVVGAVGPALNANGKLKTADILAGIKTGGWAAVDGAKKELALALTQPKPAVRQSTGQARVASASASLRTELVPKTSSTKAPVAQKPARPAPGDVRLVRPDEASLAGEAESFWEQHGRRMFVAAAFLGAFGVVIWLFARVVDVSVATTQRVVSDNEAAVGAIEENDILRKQENLLKTAFEDESSGDCNRAVIDVNRLLALRPPARLALDALLVRGRCRYALDQAEAGRKDLEEFLAQTPLSDPRRADVRQRLESGGRP